MATTTVGSIQYDVRLNLSQLRKDTSSAEKIVNDSYRKISKAQVSGSGAGSGAKTQAEAITRNTQAQVDATKKAAQESYNAIATYSPQIQRQFLAVERANNQVYNASVRSASAIQKYGTDSVQATRATNSLNVAVQNQALAQGRLDNSLNSTSRGLNLSRTGMVALTSAAVGLAAVVGSQLNAAISRSDTLANFPLVMANLKISTDESRESIQILSERLRGLPTSLDTAAQAVQRLTSVNNDVGASSALFLGLNNAVIAGGASAQLQQTAIEQLSQAYAKGRPDLVEWRALVAALPAQLNQVAQAMGQASADQLGEALRTGAVSIDDFLLTIARLNTQGENGFLSFEQQARNATGGIQTSIQNAQTAIARSIESIIQAIGRENIVNVISGIGRAFEIVAKIVIGVARAIITVIRPIFNAIRSGVEAVINALSPLRAIISGIATLGRAIGVIGDEAKDSTDSSDALAESLAGYAPPIRAATDEAGKLASQLADIDEQISKANEDYRYNLAQLVAGKNENIAKLQETLTNEKRAYDNAYAERLAGFQKSQDDEEKTFTDKTKALQNQIDFLTKYNNAANRAQLSETQFALAQENAEYQKSTALRQNEFDKQTQSAADEYEARRAENQKKLGEELALLQKHREDVLSIRNVILRDEIENLQRSRDEQIKSLNEQRAQLTQSYAQSGAESAAAFGSSYKAELIKATKLTKKEAESVYGGGYTAEVQEYRGSDGKIQRVIVPTNAFATGGFTGRGGVNEEAGIVHRGEYVLPQNMVNQSTGQPDLNKLGGGGTTVNVSLNMSGIMASGKAEMRKIASEFGKLINETVESRTGTKAIPGL